MQCVPVSWPFVSGHFKLLTIQTIWSNRLKINATSLSVHPICSPSLQTWKKHYTKFASSKDAGVQCAHAPRECPRYIFVRCKYVMSRSWQYTVMDFHSQFLTGELLTGKLRKRPMDLFIKTNQNKHVRNYVLYWEIYLFYLRGL